MVSKEQGISAAKFIDSLKYYTPSIEDIHIGYECELEENGKWYPHIITGYDSENNLIQTDTVSFYYNNNLRTTYLTKEQIESEGWEVSDHITGVWAEYKHFTLRYELKTNRLEFVNINQSHCIYDGVCPSINEFRKIVKLLGIVK